MQISLSKAREKKTSLIHKQIFQPKYRQGEKKNFQSKLIFHNFNKLYRSNWINSKWDMVLGFLDVSNHVNGKT